ncbi:glycosyltransferase [Rhodobacteraceae bacterium]|nr:glycosyltransferase [Paracoccaceae bacterium]
MLNHTVSVTTTCQAEQSWNTPFGRIDSVTWFNDKIEVSGAVCTGKLALAFGGSHDHETFDNAFSITLNRPRDRPTLIANFITQDRSETLAIPQPTALHERLARLRALPLALFSILRETPAICAFLWSGDSTIGIAVRRRLQLIDNIAGPYLPATLFGASSSPRPSAPPAIILPIFNAYDDVVGLLSRFPQSVGIDHRLILVNDGSDDPRIAKLLTNFANANPETTILVSLRRNMGFIAAVNTGLDVARYETCGHVILLNSDTIPPDDWACRLLAPIHHDRKVATVTPMSSCAEILTVPGFARAELPELSQVIATDKVAQRLSSYVAVTHIPTGIGFCMAMNRSYLDRIGGFDHAFGRGYGEEVDWCQKAQQIGGKSVATANLFVAHRGGASFGAVEKAERIQAASAVITNRYPGYDQAVQDWFHADPLAAARLALTIAGLDDACQARTPVFLGHTLGGGAEIALQKEIDKALATGCPGMVVVRVGGLRLWRVEVITPESRQIGEAIDEDQVVALLSPLKRRQVIYSCGAGGASPAAVPKLLRRLISHHASFDMRIHDFFCISPSWNLLGSDGTYDGVPHDDTSDPAHSVPGNPPVTFLKWRALWEPLVEKAQEITVFSKSSATILAKAYPIAKHAIKVCPHTLGNIPGPITVGGTNIGVLGSIDHVKGGTVLMRLASHIAPRRLVILGEMDSRVCLSSPHIVHGGYQPDQITALARRYDIGLWLIPSICPETFSFATHEALSTELPVLSFDLGAQAEAVKAAPNGYVVTTKPHDIAALRDRIEAAFDAQKLIKFRSAS